MAGFDDHVLPPEIWREIVIRLPVKSILRCKSVCKSWYSLVSCPNFISRHITNSPDKDGNRLLLQLLDVDEGDRSFSSHDMDMVSVEQHDDFHPDRLVHNKPELVIVGSCNGLICLSQEEHGLGEDASADVTVTFLIWNPTIRKIVWLPPLTYFYDTQHLSYVGFGFDSNTCDYKVMFILREDASLGEKIRKNVCEIFDLSKGVWRSISPPVPSPRILTCPEPECYLDGAVHWIDIRHWGSYRILLSFNMRDECFREIRMPDCAEFIHGGFDDRVKTHCATFGGLIHVILLKVAMNGYDVDVSESCSVWMMKEYGVTESWTKVSNIDLRSAQVLPSTQLSLLSPRNVVLWGKREILMEHRHQPVYGNKHLVLYNTESKKSKHLFSTAKYIQNICLYKESLVLM